MTVPNIPKKLPLWAPEESLIHIGSLRPQDKGTESYEGHGLSVSECPGSWEQIAKLGGNPWWNLERENANFLDWHRVSKTMRAAILEWGIANDLCKPCDVHIVEFYDVDLEERRTFSYDTAAEAHESYDDMLAEDEENVVKPELKIEKGHRLSIDACRLVGRRTTNLDETATMVALLWIERETALDGIYWHAPDDPNSYTAPRAVILPGKVAEWQITPYPGREQPIERPRSRG